MNKFSALGFATYFLLIYMYMHFTSHKSRFGLQDTLYGCCADGVFPAGGRDGLFCVEEKNCFDSEFGCCHDNETPARGPLFYGCQSDVTTESTADDDKPKSDSECNDLEGMYVLCIHI